MEERETSRIQSSVLRRVYTRKDAPARFSQLNLLPPEAIILIRHSNDIVGRRVLDIGVGSGRTTRYLSQLTDSYVGIDYSSVMVGTCREAFPQARLECVDVRDLSCFSDDAFDCVFAPAAVLDALSHGDRLNALGGIRRVLINGGLFAFSAHNLLAGSLDRRPRLRWSRDPIRLILNTSRWLRDRYNAAHFRKFEIRHDDYAILNDAAYEWRALHYYISPDAQVRQLENSGFHVLDVFDMSARNAAHDANPDYDYKLHYVCRVRKT